MPVHFSSICISLTYDTLPSPNSLTWSLCNEDISTVSHILAVFKVALSQGRFTFHHANIVRIIITNIRSFIKNIKSTVPTLKQLIKRKYVKKGSRVKNKNSYPSGILHQASGWVFLGDLDGVLSFPPRIAFTELRPDITVFSNKLIRVILVELLAHVKKTWRIGNIPKSVNAFTKKCNVIENNDCSECWG